MANPKVSILMSVYNESTYELDQSINSILEQSFHDFEFIIVNDNPDNEILKKYLSKLEDNRIIVITNEKNLGLISSLNRAFKESRGEFIARMDADDISFPTRIQEQYHYLKSHDIDMVGSYIKTIDSRGNVIKNTMKFPQHHRAICFFSKWGSCIAHPTWFARREVFSSLRGYRNALYCEDYDFILRALNKNFKLGNINKVLLKYRVRSNGISKTNFGKQYLLKDYLSRHRNDNVLLTNEEIDNYLLSKQYESDSIKYEEYVLLKSNLKNKRIKNIDTMFKNKYFWKDISEKIMLLLRESFF